MSLTHSKRSKAWAWREKYYFDRSSARRVVSFFHTHLKHLKGPLAGQPFILERWQYRMLRRLFGWKNRSDHARKFRTLFLFIAKKNGKSMLGAGIALYMLHADKEIGAEICSAAADTEQANILFAMAKDLNDKDPVLSQRAISFRRQLVAHKTGSWYKVISAVANTKHGPNWHAILFDELHSQPNRDLYDTLRTGIVARKQPLEVYMSTAGYERNSICYEVYEYAKAVAAGDVEDPSFYPVIYEAAPNDDWRLESTWKRANPNFNISVFKSYFEQKVRECESKPTDLNTFRRLHLNQWTESDVRAIDMDKWAKCGELEFNEEDLAGKPCWLGLDLASVGDLAALALVFRRGDNWAAIMRYWCPQETIVERGKRDRDKWDLWVKQGWITATTGGRIDYDRIEHEILALQNCYEIREVCIDPWNGHQLATQLEDKHGFTVVQVRQGMLTLSAPTKEFISMISEVKFEHGNNPVLSWNAANLSTVEDAAGNLMPSKKRSREKIDGCTAIINALSRAINIVDTESKYETEGVIVL